MNKHVAVAAFCFYAPIFSYLVVKNNAPLDEVKVTVYFADGGGSKKTTLKRGQTKKVYSGAGSSDFYNIKGMKAEATVNGVKVTAKKNWPKKGWSLGPPVDAGKAVIHLYDTLQIDYSGPGN
jgi:hypothetical protein